MKNWTGLDFQALDQLEHAAVCVCHKNVCQTDLESNAYLQFTANYKLHLGWINHQRGQRHGWHKRFE